MSKYHKKWRFLFFFFFSILRNWLCCHKDDCTFSMFLICAICHLFHIVIRLNKRGICLFFLVGNGMCPQVGWERSIVYALRCVLGAQMAVKTCRSDFLCCYMWYLDQVSRMLKHSVPIKVVFTAWHAKLFTWRLATCLWVFRITS